MPELPPYLSVSQVTTYLQCPRKYRFRYIDHLTPEHRSVDLALGSAVHATIGWWMAERVQGKEPTVEAIDRTYRVDWFNEGFGPRLDFHAKEPGSVVELGRALVQAYVGCFQGETPAPSAKVEERFEVEVYDRRSRRTLPLPLVGYYDIADDEGITEVKTSAKKASWKTWALQLAAYSYARTQTTGRKPAVRLVELVKTKEPTIERVELTVPDPEEAWLVEVVTEAHRSMTSGAFHPSPSYMCTKCEYWKACRRAA